MTAIVFHIIIGLCGLVISSLLAKKLLSDEADDLSISGIIVGLKDKTADRGFLLLVFVVHCLCAACFWLLMYFVVGILFATKVQTTEGVVVGKYWQQKYGTRTAIMVGKSAISQPYVYDEYVLVMDDESSGPKNVVVDMEVYAKIEKGQQAVIAEYKNIFDEHFFRIE